MACSEVQFPIGSFALFFTLLFIYMKIAENDPAAGLLTGLVLTAALALAALGLAGCAVGPSLRVLGTQEGLASFYGEEFVGRKTSSGEVFTNTGLTAAHRTFPFGTIVKVVNLASKAEVVVKINDRGPRKPERVIDLTFAAAKKIGIDRAGLGRVRLEVLEWGTAPASAAIGERQ